MKDEHWSQLDNAVYRKLHTENTITERLQSSPKYIQTSRYNSLPLPPISMLK